MQRGEQPVGVQLFDIGHVQLVGQRLTQRQRAERRVGQPGELVARRVQLVEQRATQQRLAGADLAGDLDEAFALGKRDAQQVEARLIGRQLHQEASVRRERERLLAQAEERLVHGLTSPPD